MADTFPPFRAFVFDKERDLALNVELVRELERLCECGFGLVCRRVITGAYRLDDVVAIVRLGLVGGGESPQDASRLLDAYVPARPISELLPLAIGVLESTFAGPASTKESEK